MTDRKLTIDDLRVLLATEGKTGDDAVLDFHAWREAAEMANCFMDDSGRDLADALQGWFREGLQPGTISDVVTWLEEYQDPEAIGCSRADLDRLVAEYRKL